MVPGEAWLRFEDIRPGLSAFMHGGRFGAHERVPKKGIEETRTLLRWIMTQANLGCLLTYPPVHNKLACLYDEALGFELVGHVPFADYWGGEVRSLRMYAFWRAQKES